MFRNSQVKQCRFSVPAMFAKPRSPKALIKPSTPEACAPKPCVFSISFYAAPEEELHPRVSKDSIVCECWATQAWPILPLKSHSSTLVPCLAWVPQGLVGMVGQRTV